MTRPTVLLVGDAATGTGFARVLREVFSRLVGDFTLHHLATGYNGDPHNTPWPLYPAHIGGDQFGVNRLPGLVQALQPDVIVTLADYWVQAQYAEALRPQLPHKPLVAYTPADAGPIQPEMLARLEGVARLVTFSEHARDLLQAGADAAQVDGRPVSLPKIEVMPLGVDTDVFFPLNGYPPNRAAARQALFGDLPGLDDLFVVLNANRNQPRKRIDLTLKGFAEFATGKPENVRLFLHMGGQDSGWNLQIMARRLGLQNRLMLTTDGDDMPTLASEHLNLIYNACDVGLNTSSGESWGLVAFEHAATGAPQIVPGYSTPGALWAQAALQLPARFHLTNPSTMMEEAFTSPADVADALEQLYTDEQRRADYAQRAYEHATTPRFDWGAIAARWHNMLASLANSAQ